MDNTITYRHINKAIKPKNQWTSRDHKGDNFENLVYKKLKNAGYKIKNRATRGLPYRDFNIHDIQIDAKFTHAIVCPAWIKRDWLPRFTKEARLKIVVVNWGIKLKAKALSLLAENNIKLVYYDELLDYLAKFVLTVNRKCLYVCNHLLSTLYCSKGSFALIGRFFSSINKWIASFASEIRGIVGSIFRFETKNSGIPAINDFKCRLCNSKVNGRFESRSYCDVCVKHTLESEFFTDVLKYINLRQKQSNKYVT